MKTNNEIEFPCPWEFRLIYQKESELKETIEQIFDTFNLKAKIVPGTTSTNGAYHTWRISATIQNREELDKISMRLRNLPGVKFLI